MAGLLVVLGGTGFMGRHVLQEASGAIHTVTINRGRAYWVPRRDGAPAVAGPLSRVIGDRSDEGSMIKALGEVCAIHAELCAGGAAPSVAVVDFTCDDAAEMQSLFVALRCTSKSPMGAAFVRSITRYVLVSSDSVYAPTYSSAGVREDAALCSISSKRYDGEKLRGEVQLERDTIAAVQDGVLGGTFRAVVLRLPDVLGPYDRSGRFWATVLWAASGVPMLLSPTCTPVKGQLLSFVSGVDVASMVVRIAASEGPLPGPPVSKYNIACVERVTLTEFVRLVAAEVQSQTGVHVVVRESNPPVYVDDSSDSSSSDVLDSSDDEVEACSCDYYPSVRCGPLDTSLAASQLGWAPTPLAGVVREAVSFFLRAGVVSSAHGICGLYPSECRAAVKRLPTLVKVALVSE